MGGVAGFASGVLCVGTISPERVLGQGVQAVGLCECVHAGEVRGVFWLLFRACCVGSGLRRRWVGRGVR